MFNFRMVFIVLIAIGILGGNFYRDGNIYDNNANDYRAKFFQQRGSAGEHSVACVNGSASSGSVINDAQSIRVARVADTSANDAGYGNDVGNNDTQSQINDIYSIQPVALDYKVAEAKFNAYGKNNVSENFLVKITNDPPVVVRDQQAVRDFILKGELKCEC